MNKKQAKTKEINRLLRQLDKDDGYFSVICVALDIDLESSLTEMLIAIGKLKSDNKEMKRNLVICSEQLDIGENYPGR